MSSNQFNHGFEHNNSHYFQDDTGLNNQATYSPTSGSYGGGSLRRSHTDTNLLSHLCPEDNPNGCTANDLASPLPLDRYRLNEDPCPHLIRKKPTDKVQYTQNINVRYLKPPEPPKSGDIVIREMPTRQVAPAPPLLVRQPGPRACTPPPICIRECPPTPPCPLPGRCITVPGKVLPPPARKVVIEKLPACPPKPQQIFIERWLPYEQQRQRVIYQPAKPICCIPDPKNVIIQWDTPDVQICRKVTNCGIHHTNPHEYVCKYGPTLIRPENLPEVAKKYGESAGIPLTANHRTSTLPQLEGQINALSYIDLDRAGLSHYRPILGHSNYHRSNTYFPSPTSLSAFCNVPLSTMSSRSPRFREPPQISPYLEPEVLTPSQAYVNGPLCCSKSSNYLNHCCQPTTTFCCTPYIRSDPCQAISPRSSCRSYTKTTSVLERSTSMVVKRYHC